MQKESSLGHESWLAVSSIVGSLIILIIVAITITAPNNVFDQYWVLVAAFMLWGAPSFGAILIVLGLKLKNKGESYGLVIGIGALVIFIWFWWWGVPFT